MKTGKSFIKRNIEWLILAIVMLCMHVLYLFLIGHPEGDLIYAGILDLCIIAFALCIAYIRYDRKVRYLKDMLQQPFSGEMKLPETEDVTEELYVKQLQNLTDVEEELFRIEEYVGMALQYQRINSTANDYILKQISLDTVIREVIHKYAKIMIRRKIRMHYEKTEATVISDEKWLSFVLEQLLSNAVKYTPEGEISIEVQEEPQHIWLEIRDTGIGIRSEDIPRVFEKGYTGFNGHEDKRSTGIGLYLCREVLQKLGHTIQVQSEVGEGTTVRAGFSKDAIDFRD